MFLLSAGTEFDSLALEKRDPAKGRIMKKATKAKRESELLQEYDFSKGIRGKYARRYAAGTNMVVLAPDLTEYFSDSASVNEALRAIVRIAKKTARKRTG